MKARLLPLYFSEANEREDNERAHQIGLIKSYYSDVADFLTEVCLDSLTEELLNDVDAVLFSQMIFAAFRHNSIMDLLAKKQKPIIVITSRFGTVEMWDWEIITYLRDRGCKVFSPYSIELGKTIIRAISVKSELEAGARFLMFQDSPGEGMQANIFKKFYWWEKESTETMQSTFGCNIIYRSWKGVCERARAISDNDALSISADWKLPKVNVCATAYLKSIKLYIAIKEEINLLGGVVGVGANCLNESFYCDTTPCVAWNMLFEKDGIIWACEGDTLTLLSIFILYRSLQMPIMMTNIYPFLVGMAALAHERIDKFPDIPDADNCSLGVHCGYFGFAPRNMCSEWILRPKVLAIIPEDGVMVDCRFPTGPATLAKIYPGFKKLSIIESTLEGYVQYEGSDCQNGALFRYKDGHNVMENLCSHHSIVISGEAKPQLLQIAKVFGWDCVVM
ncbi:MAG: hypothetical protein GX567_03960 [Clostridia bacterium]|nr:hypothetical protein [Clostridia bacterium]